MSGELVIPDPGLPITADDVERIEHEAIQLVPLQENVSVLEEWRSRARALEMYLRSRNLQRPILGAQRRIEARIGQLLGEAKHGGDRRSDQATHAEVDSITRDGDRADFRLLGKALGGEVELAPEEWAKSRRALVSTVRERAGLRPETPPLPEGIFRCIVADPPWRMDTGPDTFGGTGESGHDALAYEQMSVEDIKALPVEEHAADDAHLYLWTTNRYVEAAYDVARAWGFKPSVLLVWAKAPHGVGLGDAFRLTTEFVLYARRGSLKESRIVERTWFDWPRSAHSVKPDAFYELAESVSPVAAEDPAADRLEMFARKPREGWTVWGEEM